MKRFKVTEYRNRLLGCSAILASVGVSMSASAQDAQPSEWSTTYRYDGEGHVVGVILPDPDGSDGPLKYAATRTRWNTLGQVVSVETGELAAWQPSSVAPNLWPNFSVNKIEYSEYDTLGNLVKTRGADAAGNSLTVKHVIYDRLGRTICTATRMDPAQWGNQTDACKPQTLGGYGPDRITRNEYDEVGQLRKVSKAVGTPLEQIYAEYSYSANGKQESVTDANLNRAEMRYDGFDRQTEWHFPSKTIKNTASGDDYEAYGYDANGNRTTLRKRDGRVLTFVFDSLNRMTAKLIPENCAPIQVGSCPDVSATRDVYYDYDLRGLQTYARFDNSSGEGVVNTYDGFGSLLSSDTSIAGVTRTVRSQYDSNGNRTVLTYPDGAVTKFAYDRVDRLTAIRGAAGNDLTVVTYYPNGGRGWLGWGANGTGYGYDALMRLTGYNHQRNEAGAIVVDNTTLVYNPTSQIKQQTRSTDAYTWNGAVNVDRSYGVNGLNQYTGAGGNAFSYDANGNLTTETGQSFGYDAENRLVSAVGVRNVTLSYDPLGRLWQVGVPGGSVTNFTYDGDRLIAEFDGGGMMLNRYVHASGVDEPVLWYQGSNASPRQLFADHHGSIIGITEHGGNLTAVNTYDEYGIPGLYNQGRFQYTGQAWLPELGMFYYKARVYSPTLGRFLQTDPVGYVDQVNLYSYLGNDPVNGRDPSGQYEEDVHYGLTELLSRAAGISASGSRGIARGDQGVDDNPATSPMGMSPLGRAVEVREDYHFTTSERRRDMRMAFEDSGSPEDLGAYLHAKQDSFSHAGYGARFGHLIDGHAPDKTFNDVAKADSMAKSTFDILQSAKPRLGELGKSMPYSAISGAVHNFNSASTPAAKTQSLQTLSNIIDRY